MDTKRFPLKAGGRGLRLVDPMSLPAGGGKVTVQREPNKAASRDQNRFGHAPSYSQPFRPPMLLGRTTGAPRRLIFSGQGGDPWHIVPPLCLRGNCSEKWVWVGFSAPWPWELR